MYGTEVELVPTFVQEHISLLREGGAWSLVLGVSQTIVASFRVASEAPQRSMTLAGSSFRKEYRWQQRQGTLCLQAAGPGDL